MVPLTLSSHQKQGHPFGLWPGGSRTKKGNERGNGSTKMNGANTQQGYLMAMRSHCPSGSLQLVAAPRMH